MPDRPSSRRRLALVGGALVLAAMAVPTGAARALPQAQGLRVEENQSVEQEYPPIPGQNPLPGLPEYKLITPDECKTMTYCDVVPLEVVVPPTLDEADEFFLGLELSWVTEKIPEGPSLAIPGQEEGPVTSETAVNDMDLYVWDEPQGAEPIEASASADLPEELKIFRPTKGNYQIVVLNYLGPNQGYKLKATYSPEVIVPPFESLEPGFIDPGIPVVLSPAAPVEAPEPEEAPVDLSAEPEPLPDSPPAQPVPPAAPAVDLTPVAVDPDPDFADFGDDVFDEELAAPVSDVLQERTARVSGPAEPPSGTSLVLWLVILPLALLAAAGFWLARKSSTILRLG